MWQGTTRSRLAAVSFVFVATSLLACDAPAVSLPDAQPTAAGSPAVGVVEEALSAASCNDRYYACRALCNQQYQTCMKTQCTPIYCQTQRDSCVEGCTRALHRCDGG